jgi:hypothetical protein
MTLDGVGDGGHTPAALTHRKRPDTHCTEDCEGLMAGLDEYGEQLFQAPEFESRNVNSLACRYTDYHLPKIHYEVSKYVVSTNRLFVATQMCICVSQDSKCDSEDTGPCSLISPTTIKHGGL